MNTNPQEASAALLTIRNFLHEFSFEDSQHALDLIYKMANKDAAAPDETERESILSFLESVEEVIPALYKVQLKP